MDLISIIQFLQSIPYIGDFVVYIPPLVLLGSVLAVKLPGPSPTASRFYRYLFAVVQWCALAKGEALTIAQAKSNAMSKGATVVTIPVEKKKDA